MSNNMNGVSLIGEVELTSTERINFRQSRIAARLKASQEPGAANGTQQTVQSGELLSNDVSGGSRIALQGKSQIEVSRSKMNKLKSDGNELISNVRVAGDSRESHRRQEEEQKRLLRQEKLEEAAILTEAASDEVTLHWDISSHTIPQTLGERLNDQRERCQSIIVSKNAIVQEFLQELKSKDDEYVKDLKRRAEDVDIILDRENNQISQVVNLYRDQLEEVENAFMDERKEMLRNNLNEVERLMQVRRNKEVAFMQLRGQRVEEDSRQLEELRIQDAEEYNMVKIKLETDVQVLEQQLQNMRATYQLNTEKLEYNFQVLKKRDDENTITITQQKRRITRLTDVYNSLRVKFAKQDKSYGEDNAQLTEDFKRITEQYKDLQKKFRHFQTMDHKKYIDVWHMKQEDVLEHVRRVLEADKVVTEQQLGCAWFPPCSRTFDVDVTPSLSSGDTHGQGSSQGSAENLKKNPRDIIAEVLDDGDDTSARQRPGARAGTTIVDNIGSDYGDDENIMSSTAIDDTPRDADGVGWRKESSKTIKRVLELLCDEAGFLLEEKLQRLLAPLEKNEQSLMKLDGIFKALGIHSVDDVRRLADFFVVRDESGNPGRSLVPELIHPNDVTKAICAFVDEHIPATAAVDSINKDGKQHHGGYSTSSQEHSYWERMSHVVSEDKQRVWDALLDGLEQYNVVLTERWKLIRDTDALRTQNHELKTLLRQYMNAQINDELQIQPISTLPVEIKTSRDD